MACYTAIADFYSNNYVVVYSVLAHLLVMARCVEKTVMEMAILICNLTAMIHIV